MNQDRPQPLRVLIVDDSPEDRESYRRYLARGYAGPIEFSEAETVADGMACFLSQRPDCVLLDHALPDGEGVSLMKYVAGSDQPHTAVVMLTGQGNEEIAVEAMKLGASDYLVKGHLTLEGLSRAVERALEKARLLATIAEQQREKDELIVQLRDALAQVRTLRGILPICSGCKKVRDDTGYWQVVELYVSQHTEAEFSHGLCPDCLRRLYPAFADGAL